MPLISISFILVRALHWFGDQKRLLTLAVFYVSIVFNLCFLLVDVCAERMRQVGLREYAHFALFFPQLVDGPIVHYRELMP